MIDFQPLMLERKAEYDRLLQHSGERGCEYSFTNLYLWGRQKAAFLGNCLVFFSQFNRRSVYPFPVGMDLKPAVDAIIQDAHSRGIPCRLTGLTRDDCARLEALFPHKFRFHVDRDGFDYVYAIDDLADLSGRKFQKKRNHLNKFRALYPQHALVPVTQENISCVGALAEQWYESRLEEDPHRDFIMERAALKKALKNFEALQLEGVLLTIDAQPVAFAIGSQLTDDTYDIHFEKALDGFDGAYAAVNQGFAQCLRSKYPAIRWLNREDDLGLEGLRKAKLSYCPDHMVEKSWACLLEDGYDY